MRDDELQLGTRDKVVTKMTRDGAVEENISTNSERGVSARASDADFSHLHGDDQPTTADSAEKSGTKLQQRRYYRGQSDSFSSKQDQTISASDSAMPSTSQPGESPEIEYDTDSARTALDDSISCESLSQSSARSENVRSDRSDSESTSTESSESTQHRQKKKQVAKDEKKRQKESRLSFDEDAGLTKGTNLGGRFSSLTSQAAMAGKQMISATVDPGETDENDVSSDVADYSETAAVATTQMAERHQSSRTTEKSSRSERIEHKAEVKAAKLKFESETEAAGQTVKAAEETVTETEKVNTRRAIQRRTRNKRYASVFRLRRAEEAAGVSGTAAAGKAAAAQTAGTFADRVKNSTVAVVRKNKAFIAILLAGTLIAVAILGSIGTFGTVIAGTGTTVMQSTYLASDDEIYAAEGGYSAMETALQQQLDQIESTYPGYDEYRYQVDEISHNPYSLTSYLTVLYGNYQSADVQNELTSLFQEQYHLSVESTTETVTETRSVRVGESLGSVVTSGYCNCSICCGSWSGGPTASGVYPTSNHTIAVDSNNPTVPMGTKIVMNGVEYTVEDTGNFDRYGVDFDVYYDSHSAASAHGHQTWEAYIADDNGTQTVEVTETRTIRVLNVTLSNSGFDIIARNRLSDTEAINWYNILNTAYGNRDYLWDTAAYSNYTPEGMSYEIPPEALTDARFRNMITEAERYLGYPYVWGGSSPSTSFDCSGFVSWVVNHCGNGWSVGRQTANGLRSLCTYVSPDQAKPGDLIFFQNTYNTTGASHVGIYVGNGMMIHCGSPIKYSSIETSYWQEHFLCFGRLPSN